MLLLIVLDGVISPRLKFYGISPNMVFCVAMIFAIFHPPTGAVTFAAVLGGICDIIFSKVFGAFFFPFILVAVLISFIYTTYFEDAVLIEMAVLFLGSLAFSFISAIIVAISGADFLSIFTKVVLIQLFYNFIVSLIFLFVFRTFIKRQGYRVG